VANLLHGRGEQAANWVQGRRAGLAYTVSSRANELLFKLEMAIALDKHRRFFLLGLPIKIDKDGRITNWRVRPPEGMSTAYPDVLEHLADYTPYLSERQIAMARDVLAATRRIGRALEDWGQLELPAYSEVGAVDEIPDIVRAGPDAPAGVVQINPESQGYVPRVVRIRPGEKWARKARSRPDMPRHMTSAEAIIKNEGQLYGLEEALNAYAEAAARMVNKADMKSFTDDMGWRGQAPATPPAIAGLTRRRDSAEALAELAARAWRGEEVPLQALKAHIKNLPELEGLDIPGAARIGGIDGLIAAADEAAREGRFRIPPVTPGKLRTLWRRLVELEADLRALPEGSPEWRETLPKVNKARQQWGFARYRFKQEMALLNSGAVPVSTYREWLQRRDLWPVVEVAPRRFLRKAQQQEVLQRLRDYLLGPSEVRIASTGRRESVRTGGLLRQIEDQLREEQKLRSARAKSLRVSGAVGEEIWRGMRLPRDIAEGLASVLPKDARPPRVWTLETAMRVFTTVKTGLDVGAALTFGILAQAVDALAIGKLFLRQFKSALDPAADARFWAEHRPTIAKMARYGIVPELGEAAAMTGLQGIKGHTFGRMGRAFTNPLFKQAVLAWEAMEPTPAWKGRLPEMASAIRDSIGRWSPAFSGISPSVTGWASLVVALAPRYLMSAVHMASMLRYGPGDPRGRFAAAGLARILASMYGLYAIFGGAYTLAGGQDTKRFVRGLDPGSGGDFLTIDAGGYRVGLGGVARALLTLSARTGSAVAPGGEPVSNLWSTRGGPASFLFSRGAPVQTLGGFALESLSGEDFAPYQNVHPPKAGLPFARDVAALLAPFTASAAIQGEPGWSLPFTAAGFNVTQNPRARPLARVAALPQINPIFDPQWSRDRERAARKLWEGMEAWKAEQLRQAASPDQVKLLSEADPLVLLRWYATQVQPVTDAVFKDAFIWSEFLSRRQNHDWRLVNPEWLAMFMRYDTDPNVRDAYKSIVESEWYNTLRTAVKDAQGKPEPWRELDVPEDWYTKFQEAQRR